MAAKCRIIADSTCDLSARQARDLGVDILVFHYTEAGKTNGGLEGDDDLFSTITPHEFYDAIRYGACPMTSPGAPDEYDRMFREAYETGIPTVFFSLSSGLSSAYDTACASLERLKEAHPAEEVRIYIVDTLSASAAFTLLLVEACRKRDEGLNAEELVLWANEARWKMHVLFMVENLEALHRGGRVSKGVSVIGDALDVKALLHFDLKGKLEIKSVARGKKRAMRFLVDYLEKNRKTEGLPDEVSVGDADVPDDGYLLASAIRKVFPTVNVLRPTIGPTIGCHVGPGMLAVVFWGTDRRNDKKLGKVKGVRTAR